MHKAEAVLAGHYAESATIVPIHMEGADIVDDAQGAHGSRLDWRKGVFHAVEPDAASDRVLFP